MSRILREVLQRRNRFPRASGDEPALFEKSLAEYAFSPRERDEPVSAYVTPEKQGFSPRERG